MNIAKFSVKKPVTILMIILMILTLGTVSLLKIPIDLYPKIEVPVAIVSTSYANVGPEEVEKLITKPLEQSLATVEDIKEINSISKEGNSVIIVQFNFGTDMNFATLRMREKVDMIKGFLPKDAKDPMVLKIDPNAQPIMYLSLTNGKDLSTMQSTADNIVKNRLEGLKGIASVNVSGGYENEISVKVNQQKLEGYNLSIDYISKILSAENLNLPAGKVKKGNQELLLRTVGEFKNIDEVKNLPIPLKSGGTVYLKDIAQVELTHKDINSISKTNGKRCINIAIQKQSDANTIEAAKRVKKELDNLKKDYPNINFEIGFDSSEYIEKSINNVSKSAIEGAILAILILFVFLRNIRSTFIIGTSIPISIIATFILLYFNNISINLMTLGGLSLGVGMLVDNSIVVLENIYRFRQEGNSREDASIKGSTEVTTAVIASTLTTIAVFLPIVFVKGITGTIFKELSLTVTFSLVASLAIALTLIPMLSSKFLKMEVKDYSGTKFEFLNKIYKVFDNAFEKLNLKYKNLLKKALSRRRATVLIAVGIFVLSTVSLFTVGAEFFPKSDEGQFSISIELPEGSKVKDTDNIVSKVNDKIKGIKEVKSVFSYAGNSSYSFSNSGENIASMNVMLVPIRERKRSTSDVMDELTKKVKDIPGAKIEFTGSQVSFGGSSSPIDIKIKGDDLETLKKLGNEVKKIVENVKGTRQVKSSLTDGKPELQIRLNRESASQYGITAAQVSSQVKSLIEGNVATKYRLQGDEIDVNIKGEDTYSESLSNLKQAFIENTMGIKVPLSLIADINIKSGISGINREDQKRVLDITSEIYGRDLKSVQKDIQSKIKYLEKQKGYSIEMGGQSQDMMEAFTDLALALILAVLLVYMVLASQFESLLNPFIIMFSVPLALAGGSLGLFITRRPLCVPAIIGFIILAGIVVNNAIVLIDYINTRRKTGENREEAILNAGPIRLRPILMTTLTTVLGLVPMALGIGDGAETQAPMATVVIGGLLLSTLLTLVFIPVVYTIFDDFASKVKSKRAIRKMHK
ncbi:swarming motility protein SwrC [Clostridium acetireducens DSM 10703]|uniref:Swarming motility protein SwrC n=1 Tax=Clostridium acetireducens DSM 10703 TaxID=1121290 RepID=A0A1E8F021_9CLOT|nr:efflux RND transporter permease subunit [Clostridium acetireducens]OFI06751.1 swarming motility protein SwrC [Clostridium acetireducens DSM 10703]